MLQREHSAILLTSIKLPFCIKSLFCFFFNWPLWTGFTVLKNINKTERMEEEKKEGRLLKMKTFSSDFMKDLRGVQQCDTDVRLYTLSIKIGTRTTSASKLSHC